MKDGILKAKLVLLDCVTQRGRWERVKIGILFIVGILLSNCYLIKVPNYVKNSYTNCYDGTNKGLDTLLNINGYFYSHVIEADDSSNIDVDTLEYSNLGETMVLFADGKVAYQRIQYLDFKKLMDSKISSKELNIYFEAGGYILKKNRIIVQYIVEPTLHNNWQVHELEFRINSSDLLELISRKKITNNGTTLLVGENGLNLYLYSKYRFEKNNFLPDIDFPNKYKVK